MYDPELYRDKVEVEAWKHRDPIEIFLDRMVADGTLDAGAMAELDAEIARELDDAVAFAEAGTLEPVEDLTRFVSSEAPES